MAEQIQVSTFANNYIQDVDERRDFMRAMAEWDGSTIFSVMYAFYDKDVLFNVWDTVK